MSLQPSAIQALKQRQEERKQQALAEQAARERNLVEQFERNVRETLPAELLAELQAEFTYRHSGSVSGLPAVSLTYRGHTQSFSRDNVINAVTFGRNPDRAIAEWIDQIDRQIADFEREKQETRDQLLRRLPERGSLQCLEKDAKLAAKYGLDQDTEIAGLLASTRARIEAALAEYQRQHEEEQRRYEQRRQAQVQELVDLFDSLQTFGDFDRLRDRDDKYDYDVAHDARVCDAEARADARYKQLADQHNQDRLAAQAAAFHSWIYYKVRYGIAIPVDGDDGDEEHLIDFDCFHTLDDGLPADGFFAAADTSERIKPIRIIDIREIVVRDHTEQPYWAPARSTEWGDILVPPEAAKRP
ncbi:MAG: hypothetical protein JW741_06080 [Sedimentisphaerales bacterium]|nr:hypothetical protein [Sedimentisphaerales bacterium]